MIDSWSSSRINKIGIGYHETKSYSNVLLKTVAINTYEEHYNPNVLGLSCTHHLSKPDDVGLEKFESQLTQDENGYFGASIFW